MTLLKGVFKNAFGDPMPNHTIMFTALRSTQTVMNTVISEIITGANGEYEKNIYQGKYQIDIFKDGVQKTTVGIIEIYADSPDADINTYLTLPGEAEVTPEFIQQVIELKNQAVQSADSALISKDAAAQSAKSSSDSASNAANSESSAKKSATDAAKSATDSADNKTAAAASAKSAADSQSAAAASATTASDKASNAASSATAASSSASKAATSETNAKASEQAAAASASSINPDSLVQSVNGISGKNISLAAKDIKLAIMTGSSASARSLEDFHGEIVSVRDFGAKGDNSGDDTAAFNAAAAWASAKPFGATIRVPAGRYIMSAAVKWQGGKVFWAGEGVACTFLNWKTGSASGGFVAGDSTPLNMFKMTGIYMWTDAVINNAAIKLWFTGSSPKNCVVREVTASGGAVGGTLTDGYWKEGLLYVIDPVYPAFQDCYFYGIGGSLTPTKAANISGCFTVVAKNTGIFFSNFINCFGNGANNGAFMVSQTHPGIEGSVFWGCNFNSVNTGFNIDASGSGDTTYRPPQTMISNSQVEYIQRAFVFNNVSTCIVDDVLAYAAPDYDEALTHVFINNSDNIKITNSTMHSRPIHTKCNGVLTSGDCSLIDIDKNVFTVSPTGFSVVFAGTTKNSTQTRNKTVSGNAYSNQSSNKKTNTAEDYEISGEYSHTVGGYVEKFGAVDITIGTNGIGSVNFKAPFPNIIISVIPSNGNYNASMEQPVLGAFNVNAFDVKFPTAPTQATTRTIHFIARGK